MRTEGLMALRCRALVSEGGDEVGRVLKNVLWLRLGQTWRHDKVEERVKM